MAAVCVAAVRAWTEDSLAAIIGLALFSVTALLSAAVVLEPSATTVKGGFAALLLSVAVIIPAHLTRKPPTADAATESSTATPVLFKYILLTVGAACAAALGSLPAARGIGLGASFWAVIIGLFTRNAAAAVSCNTLVAAAFKLPLTAEFFIKTGIVLLAMDYSTIAQVGAYGLVIAWVDTGIVWYAGYRIVQGLGLLERDAAIVVAGATTICGSSAAASLGTTLGIPKSDPTVSRIIALMGLLNTPLMVLLPLTAGWLPARVLGAWIGGSVDSTGQVIATAALVSNHDTLLTATVIKLAQNLFIIIACMILSAQRAGSAVDRKAVTEINETVTLIELALPREPDAAGARCRTAAREIVSKVPKFIAGFVVASGIVTILPDAVQPAVLQATFAASEWVSLIGFVLIGADIALADVFHSHMARLFVAYVIIQAIDIATTLGWSVLLLTPPA